VDLANDSTLRAVVKAALRGGTSPSRFMGARRIVTYEYDSLSGRLLAAIESPEWTEQDRELIFALEEYEAQCCPEGHYLPETTKVEHQDAYRAEPPILCHYCKAQHLIAETAPKQHSDTAGLYFPIVLDQEVVELNQQPVPPLPPGLQGE
jgi:hypothetical protein